MGRSPQAPAPVPGKAGTGEPPPALAAPTERGGEEPVHDDVCIAADGRGEVGVKGHVQGVVAKEGLVLQDASAEVESHLEGVRREEKG